MTDQKITKYFPDSEFKGLNHEKLKEHLQKVIHVYFDWLQSQEIPSKTKLICRTTDNGICCNDEQLPSYPRWLSKEAYEILKKEDVINFFQYLWNQGAIKRGYTGPNLTRRTWEISLLNEFIHAPLVNTLNTNAVENAIDQKEGPIVEINQNLYEKLINELVLRICNKNHRFIATCPLAWIKGKSGQEYKLTEEISLKIYTERERAIYLTKHHYKVSVANVHSSLSWSKAVLEITGYVNYDEGKGPDATKTKGEVAEEHFSSIIDCVKWAFFVAYKKNVQLLEGEVYYEDYLGGAFSPSGFLRREDISQGTTYIINNETLVLIKKLIFLILKYTTISEDIRQAMWHWGRSCHYNLSRDILLESIIGLEGLLVANAGETRYKFGLHGALFISPRFGSKEEIARKLRVAYDGRSSIAHGSKKKKRIKVHNDTREYLADAIYQIIELYEEEVLNPAENVSKQIEKIILKNINIRKNV